jgi:XTP/dITP diphosphohydrolase
MNGNAGKIVLATTNPGKIREFETMLSPQGFTVLSLRDFPKIPETEETGETFLANALLKARNAAQYIPLPVLADDSGLQVDALHGLPGVRSARFAGENATDSENVQHLLERMNDIPREKRAARFVCCLAYVAPDGTEVVAEGFLEGWIARAPRGEAGFGYDPVFCPEGSEWTLAEMGSEQKNRISHRRKAVERLLHKLHELGLA